jgi:LPXTG-motif cell wall-anchored protein
LLDILLPGDSVDCTATYEISQTDIEAGRVNNCALATGMTGDDFEDDIDASVSDEACFETPVPQTPSINIEKSTNGHDADTPPGPPITVGERVGWKYVVTNDGNVALSDVTVTDDVLGDVCLIGDLGVGASDSCELTGEAVVGDYANEGTATGIHGEQTIVTDTDMSHYFGQTIAASAQIGDTVWNDENQNGVQDNGEKGIAGATVKLTNPDNTTVEVATNSNGLYLFAALEPGTYTVEVILSSIPPPADGENKLTTAGSFTIQLAEARSYLDADFGVVSVLPKTGISADQIAYIALSLLLAGGAALLVTRRKNDGESDIAA